MATGREAAIITLLIVSSVCLFHPLCQKNPNRLCFSWKHLVTCQKTDTSESLPWRRRNASMTDAARLLVLYYHEGIQAAGPKFCKNSLCHRCPACFSTFAASNQFRLSLPWISIIFSSEITDTMNTLDNPFGFDSIQSNNNLQI